MRHCYPTKGASLFSTYHANGIRKPYFHQYIDSWENSRFANADSTKAYVKVLQYVEDHEGCKRTDIIRDVWHKDVTKMDPNWPKLKAYRGYGSIMLAQLLYINVIDYNKDFCYYITERGREVLRKAYINDNIKICKEITDMCKGKR